jgi:protein SCO1/2
MRIAFLTLLCLALACKKPALSTLPVYNRPSLDPLWLPAAALNSDSIHRVAPFALLDQNGDTLRSRDLDGKIYVANFFFSICPSICPKMANNLQQIQSAFADDPNVKILSHTVMPWVDSVAQLRAYGERMGIKPQQWHLLTGSRAQIYRLARQSYFAEEEIGYNRDSTEFLHTEHVLLVDTQRRLRGIYKGTLPLEIQRLQEDILLLKKEN